MQIEPQRYFPAEFSFTSNQTPVLIKVLRFKLKTTGKCVHTGLELNFSMLEAPLMERLVIRNMLDLF